MMTRCLPMRCDEQSKPFLTGMTIHYGNLLEKPNPTLNCISQYIHPVTIPAQAAHVGTVTEHSRVSALKFVCVWAE